MKDDVTLQVENLSKRYYLRHPREDENGLKTNELWALKDISFSLRKGESLGVIGPNGSGKSTLLRILAGVTKPTEGRVEIVGRVASILDIGAGFHPELTGRENVFMNGRLLGFSKAEIKNKFEAIADFSGIAKFIDEPVKNYSSGMYLRLAFSIMAQLEADIFLIDETFEAGDAEFRMKAKEALGTLLAGKTMVFVSHNINELSTLTDRTLEIRNGRATGENALKSFLGANQLYSDKTQTSLPLSLPGGATLLSAQFDRDPGSENFIRMTFEAGRQSPPPMGILMKNRNNVIVFSSALPDLTNAGGTFELIFEWKEKNVTAGMEYSLDLIVDHANETNMQYYPKISVLEAGGAVQPFNKGLISPQHTWKINSINRQKIGS